MQLPRPGWAEVDAEATWWHEVCDISRTLIAQVPPGRRWPRYASAVSGRAWCSATRLCGPLRPAILYGMDTRATAEIDLLTEELGADAILDRAGTVLSSQAVGPKMEWVRRHEPEVFARATRWYGSNSYIAAKLTGEYVMDHHTASQCDPLYATRQFDWNAEWAQRICGHLQLPRLVWPSDIVGTIHDGGRRGHGPPLRHACDRRHRRCLRGGVLGWGPQTGRSNADVRLDDVSRADHRLPISAIPRFGRRRGWSAKPWPSPQALRLRAAW